MVFGFFAVGVLHDDSSASGPARRAAAFAFTALLLVAMLMFALAGRPGWRSWRSSLSSSRGDLVGPSSTTWVNQQITDSSVRATVISIDRSGGRGRPGRGGPVLGLVGNVWGIRAALAIGALVLAPALVLYGRAMRHGGKEPELEELPAPTAWRFALDVLRLDH